MHVLGVLEGDPVRFRSLLDPLRAMVDAQLACQASSPRRGGVRQVHRPRPPRPRVPDAIVQRFDDLVCVVGEANAWPYRAGERPDEPEHRDELVHWVAHRVATGQTFGLIVAPERALSPSTAFHIELAEDELRAGAPRSELAPRFARFARPSDLLCAWGHHGLDLGIAAGLPPAERLDLRAEARRIANQKLGSFEDYAAAIGPPPPPLAPGRAGRRLALLVQVVQAWRALATAG